VNRSGHVAISKSFGECVGIGWCRDTETQAVSHDGRVEPESRDPLGHVGSRGLAGLRYSASIENFIAWPCSESLETPCVLGKADAVELLGKRRHKEGDIVVAEGLVHVLENDSSMIKVQFCDLFEFQGERIWRITSYGAMV